MAGGVEVEFTVAQDRWFCDMSFICWRAWESPNSWSHCGPVFSGSGTSFIRRRLEEGGPVEVRFGSCLASALASGVSIFGLGIASTVSSASLSQEYIAGCAVHTIDLLDTTLVRPST